MRIVIPFRVCLLLSVTYSKIVFDRSNVVLAGTPPWPPATCNIRSLPAATDNSGVIVQSPLPWTWARMSNPRICAL